MKHYAFSYEFIDSFPVELEEGVLYVSTRFAAAAHKCACGCGNLVHTRLSPTDWKLTFDGRTVSLYPSIGNWSFPCNSHYWITRNKVEWARRWTDEEIEAGRASDKNRKESRRLQTKLSLWQWIKKWS